MKKPIEKGSKEWWDLKSERALDFAWGGSLGLHLWSGHEGTVDCPAAIFVSEVINGYCSKCFKKVR